MVTAILVGAGARGMDAYGSWIAKHRGRARILAVAEPREARRSACAAEHGVGRELQFEGWEELLARPRMAEACIVATQDRDHTGPALAAMAAGYHVLLEKPMAPTEEECRRLVAASEESGAELRICHVLRYTPFYATLKSVIDSGAIGRIASIAASENVSYWHFGHSFVRGNWRRSGDSNPLILAKSCHDMDLLAWISGSPALTVNSSGSLSFYRPENAPAGAPLRCSDGCPSAESCPWFAPRLYLRGGPVIANFRHSPSPLVRLAARAAGGAAIRNLVDWRQWPSSTISDEGSKEARLEALRSGPYGRCVFHCDNDVVDRQTVGIEFGNGIVANFNLHGLSYEEGRRMRIDGTEGCLEGSFGFAGSVLRLHEHRSGRSRTLLRRSDISGHGGGDEGVMESFVGAIEARRGGKSQPGALTSARASLESHLICFAAERSRLEGRRVAIERD